MTIIGTGLRKEGSMQKKEDKRSPMLYGALVLSYLLVRYGLFSLHGMKAWPPLMALLALALLELALYKNKKRMQVFLVAAYSLTFLGAKLFSTKAYDPGGGRLDNIWVLWSVSYLFLSFLAYFWKEKN